jgi:hypothetical protein
MNNTLDEQHIRALAYRIWEDEGRPDGRAESHWNEALRQLMEAPRNSADSSSAQTNQGDWPGQRWMGVQDVTRQTGTGVPPGQGDSEAGIP